MPTYLHSCQSCNHEWESEYSIKADPPTECPECHEQTAKRMISLNSPGRVELSHDELTVKLKQDAKDIQKRASKDPYLYDNLLGGGKLHEMQKRYDRG